MREHRLLTTRLAYCSYSEEIPVEVFEISPLGGRRVDPTPEPDGAS
jgi:hypothetical protein